MKFPSSALLMLTLTSSAAYAQVNAGTKEPEPSLPFTMTQVATFNLPWRIAFLPDGRMLVTEKGGPGLARDAAGREDAVANVPAVLTGDRAACSACSCRRSYATDQTST
jgi:glucose/arabinose dehydrogenase